jgi:O-methyltransferase
MKKIISRILFSLLKKRGFTVIKEDKSIINSLAYSYPIIPFADYAPWRNDDEFNKSFFLVKDNTMITEPQRMYELWQLSKEVKDLEGDYIEVGSWRGGSGALIAMAAKINSLNFNVYLCDTFEGVVKASKYDNVYINKEHDDTSVEIATELIDKLNLKENVKILKGIFPDQTGNQLKNNKFKFCHIDVDVYESAKSIVDWIWDKMVVGGVIVFDDFGFKSMQGITIFVESQRLKSDRIVIHNLNGHGIIIRTK